MHKTAQAIILRVDRRNAGRTVAFDRLYFFRQEEEMLLPQIFPWCLVIPYNKEFAEVLLSTLFSVEVRTYPHRRIPGESGYTTRVGGEWLLRELEVDAYLAVVPMLHTTRARRTSISSPAPTASPPVYAHPQYIMATPQIETRSRSRTRALRQQQQQAAPLRQRQLMGRYQVNEPGVYLLQNGVRVEAPICQTCTNSLAYLQNDCSFGSMLCYEHLISMQPTAWQEGVRRLNELRDVELDDGEGDVDGL